MHLRQQAGKDLAGIVGALFVHQPGKSRLQLLQIESPGDLRADERRIHLPGVRRRLFLSEEVEYAQGPHPLDDLRFVLVFHPDELQEHIISRAHLKRSIQRVAAQQADMVLDIRPALQPANGHAGDPIPVMIIERQRLKRLA